MVNLSKLKDVLGALCRVGKPSKKAKCLKATEKMCITETIIQETNLRATYLSNLARLTGRKTKGKADDQKAERRRGIR